MPSGSYSTRIGSLRSATKLQRCGLAEGAKHANRLQPGCTELPASRELLLTLRSNRSPIHAFLPPARFVCLALPRYAGHGKNSQPVQLQGAVALPFFAGADSTIARVPFRLRSGIVHLGSEPTSGHYRSNGT